MSRAFLVADLGYGDSGKGTVVDWLTETHAADLVVRYNGGPQAGHNVVRPDGRHHTFAQFGSGSFSGVTRTLLADPTLIEPYAMLIEADHLTRLGVPDVLARTTVDARCRVITPPQQIANRVRERSRGADAHGTCGMGVGEAVADALARPDLAPRAADFADAAIVREKLRDTAAYKREDLGPRLAFALPEERRVFDDLSWIDVAVETYAEVARHCRVATPAGVRGDIRQARCVVFEGAQGVLLDEHFGFAPHTTWSDTTFRPAENLLADAGYPGDVCRIGVTRTYATRHGAGPLVTEDDALPERLPEPHNDDAGWQGRFRRGPLDLVALRYAVAALGGDLSLAVTHLDRLPLLPPVACGAYAIGATRQTRLDPPVAANALAGAVAVYREWPTHDADVFVAAVEAIIERRVTVRSFGPTWRDKSTNRF